MLAVMLGLRNSYKEDMQATAVEMVYGTPLRQPGEFFVDNDTDTNFNISKFRKCKLYAQDRQDIRRLYFIFNNLFNTTHVRIVY